MPTDYEKQEFFENLLAKMSATMLLGQDGRWELVTTSGYTYHLTLTRVDGRS